MKKIIFLSLCLFLGAFSLSAQQTIYVIDNVTVENFDGSQLNGKTIKDYKISTTGSGRNAVTIHSISTSTQPSIFSFTGTFPQFDLDSLMSVYRFTPDSFHIPDISQYIKKIPRKIVYVVDGVEYEDSLSPFDSVSPMDIKNITVLKNGSPEQLKYGEDCTVIVIETTKKRRNN
jgi:hypothetical protein